MRLERFLRAVVKRSLGRKYLGMAVESAVVELKAFLFILLSFAFVLSANEEAGGCHNCKGLSESAEVHFKKEKHTKLKSPH